MREPRSLPQRANILPRIFGPRRELDFLVQKSVVLEHVATASAWKTRPHHNWTIPKWSDFWFQTCSRMFPNSRLAQSRSVTVWLKAESRYPTASSRRFKERSLKSSVGAA
jgi:hypothetical protein